MIQTVKPQQDCNREHETLQNSQTFGSSMAAFTPGSATVSKLCLCGPLLQIILSKL